MPYIFGGRTRRYIKVLYSFVVNTTGHKNTFVNTNVDSPFTVQWPIELRGDNQGLPSLANKFHQCTKHIALRQRFISE